MKSPSSFRPLIPAASLAFLAMVFTGWKVAAPSPGSDATTTENATAGSPGRHAGSRHRPPAEAQQTMDAIRRSHDPLERARATIALANSLPVSSFTSWVNAGWFNVRQGPELTIFTKILMERWQNEDPDGFLDWQMSSKSQEAGSALSTLMKESPEKALALLKKYPDSPAAKQALMTLSDTDPAAVLEALCSIANRNSDGSEAYNYHDLFKKIAARDTAGLDELIAKFPPAYSDQIKAAIWNRKLSDSFSENIEKLWQLPDGFKIFQNSIEDRNKLDPQFFEKFAGMPASWKMAMGQNYYQFVSDSNAGTWLNTDLTGSGLSKQAIKQIQAYALRQYAQSHPDEAFQWVGAAGIEPSEKANLYSQMLAGLGNKPEKQQQLIDSIESSDDRAAAAAALDNMKQQTARRSQSDKPQAPVTPENFFETLATKTKPGDYSSIYSLTQELSSWDAGRIETLQAQFPTLPEDQKLAVSKAMVQVSSNADGNSPLKNQAFAYLLAHSDEPKENQANSMGSYRISGQVSQYVVNWSAKDPEGASTWVNTLPDGDAKTWAMKNLARNWQLYDPEAVDRWMGALPAGQKTEVQKYLDSKK